jgi:hypothetical protein
MIISFALFGQHIILFGQAHHPYRPTPIKYLLTIPLMSKLENRVGDLESHELEEPRPGWLGETPSDLGTRNLTDKAQRWRWRWCFNSRTCRNVHTLHFV